MHPKENAKAQVAELVSGMNRSWLAGRIDELVPLFHPDVVMAPPGGGERMIGREVMIESFRQYVGSVKTHAFDELDLTVDAFGATAVVTLRFRVRYEVGGEVHDEEGTDLLVLARTGDRWRIVWRSQIPG
jgi:hypothetical protein